MSKYDVSPLQNAWSGGAVTLDIRPIDSATANFTLKYDGQQLLNEDYSRVFETGDYPRQQRARIRNDCIDELEAVDGVDAADIGEGIEAWLSELKEEAEDVESELAGPLVREIVDGTQTPVEIHEAPDENTTWYVTLSFRGRTRELEFDASAMVGDSSGELANKIVHNFNEVVEPTSEDWERIRDHWVEHKQVVDQTKESEQTAVTDRFLSVLSDAVRPTQDREKFLDSIGAAWVDTDNILAVEDADTVVYIEDDLLVDEIETMGKTLDYKSQLLKNLRKRGALYGKKRPSSWTEGSERIKVWAFDPVALGVDPKGRPDIGEDATSEVSP